jgi:hypothetical protein
VYRTGCRGPVKDLADSSLRSISQPSGAVTRSSNVSASRSSRSAAGSSASRSLNRRVSLQRRRADDEGHGYSRCLALHLRLDRICPGQMESDSASGARVSATKVGHKTCAPRPHRIEWFAVVSDMLPPTLFAADATSAAARGVRRSERSTQRTRTQFGISERPIPLSAVWSYAQITLIRAVQSAAAARWHLRQIGGSARVADALI